MIGQQHDMLALALASAGGSGGGGGGAALALSALQDIAQDYSASSTYSKGDYRLYDRKLYRAKQDINAPEAFTAAHWEQVDVGSVLAFLCDTVETKLPPALLAAFPQETIPDAPVASFDDGADGLPVKDLVIDITPVQSGSGDPAPDNIRPISGWTGCNLVISPTQDAQDGTTIPISWGSEAGTMYGGTLDVTTGVLTVNYLGIVVDGRTRQASDIVGPMTGEEYTRLAGKYRVVLADFPNDTAYNAGVFICSHFVWLSYQARKSAYPDQIYWGTSTRNVYWASDIFTTLAEFNGYLRGQYDNGTPVTLVARISDANAQTYQLTPIEVKTLLGANNIWADTGNVKSLTYRADPQRYVEMRINAAKNIIAGVETAMTATKNYVTGDLLIVGDALYTVTATISNGEAITSGTNVVATTVAEQLIALANA